MIFGCFMQILTKEEGDKMNREMIQWVREALKGKYSTYVYNILNQLRSLLKNITEI